MAWFAASSKRSLSVSDGKSRLSHPTTTIPISPASPLWRLSHRDLVEADAELLVLLIGTDETVSQSVHSRSSYQAEEIVWGAKFANMFMRNEAEGIIGMNLDRIHDIEPVLLM